MVSSELSLYNEYTKKGFSFRETQRQLSLKHYEPVLAMIHKLRKARVEKRDDKHNLKMDEGYFTIEASEQAQKSGCGS